MLNRSGDAENAEDRTTNHANRETRMDTNYDSCLFVSTFVVLSAGSHAPAWEQIPTFQRR